MMAAALLPALLLALPLRLTLQAPEDAPPDAALSWSAWSAGLASRAEPVLFEEHVGARAPRTIEASLPEAGRWIVLVQGESGGDAWFALAAFAPGPASSEPALAALRPIPVPVVEPPDAEVAGVEVADGRRADPAADRGRRDRGEPPLAGVLLRWGASAPFPGVASWQVMRLAEGREPELVGEVAAAATSFRDDPPPGVVTWALRPVFLDGVVGPLGRASDPGW